VLAPPSAGHDHIIKLAACEKAGLAHPTDHIMAIHRRAGMAPTVIGTVREMPIEVLAGVVIRRPPDVTLLVSLRAMHLQQVTRARRAPVALARRWIQR